MKASDVMTQAVVSIRASQKISDAVSAMLEHNISALPVLDDGGKLVGMISEGDLLRRAETGTERQRPRWLEFLASPGKKAEEYVHTHGRYVSEVMTPAVVSVSENAPLGTIVDLLEKHRIKRVPVVRDGTMVGIVSRANLLQALSALSVDNAGAGAKDSTLRRHILAELQRETWSPRYSVNVVVRHGEVHLWGCLFDERERQAVRVIAENTSGVKRVHDHMIWLEPYSGMTMQAPAEDKPSGSAAAALLARHV